MSSCLFCGIFHERSPFASFRFLTATGFSWCATVFRFGIELLVQSFTAVKVLRFLSLSKFSADQILVDLGEHCVIGIKSIEHGSLDAFALEFANSHQAVPTSNQDIAHAAAWPRAHHDWLQQTLS